jgi:hypothetical protein
MKLWEVAKGLEEGKYKYGDEFEVFYLDGDFYSAKVGSHNCLWWTIEEAELALVHLAIGTDSFWKHIIK